MGLNQFDTVRFRPKTREHSLKMIWVRGTCSTKVIDTTVWQQAVVHSKALQVHPILLQFITSSQQSDKVLAKFNPGQSVYSSKMDRRGINWNFDSEMALNTN